jgi:protein-glutamine gamma-glutamyltransferase
MSLLKTGHYRREDLLIVWMLAALFFSLPLLFCISLLCFIITYAWLPAPWRAQHRFIIITGLLTGSTLAFISLPILFSGESLLALTALIATLKRAELQSDRDRMVLVIAIFIVNVLNLIYWNHLAALLHLMGLIGLMLWLVQQPGQKTTDKTSQKENRHRSRKLSLNPGISIVAWSLPMALILFLFMPRLPGPLWDVGLAFGLPISIYQDLTPGSITNTAGKTSLNNPLANLQAQQRIVLVAEFTSAVPSKSTLYWRGPVIYGYEQNHEQGNDEGKWLADTENTNRSQRLRTAYRDIPAYQSMLQHRHAAVNYDIKVAPNSDYWLYAPDLPLANAQESFISKDGQLLSIRPIHEEFTYSTSSYLDGTLRPLKIPEVRHSSLPSTEAEAIRDTVTQWQKALLDSTEETTKDLNNIVLDNSLITNKLVDSHSDTLGKIILGDLSAEKIIHHKTLEFLSNPPEWFNPQPPYTSDKLQHWVGITMLMLQQAGLPARMVSGFRSGDLIALTNVIVVRQKHRHYWLELWQSDQGWVKIDIRDILSRATTAQDAARTKTSSAPASQLKEMPPSTSLPESPDLKKIHWLQQLDEWLHHYSPTLIVDDENPTTTQSETNIRPWMWAVILLLAWFALLIYSRQHQQRPPTMTRAWLKLRQTLATQGFVLEHWQCPSLLATQLHQHQPVWNEAALRLINIYLNYQYSLGNEVNPRAYNAQVKRLSLVLKDVAPLSVDSSPPENKPVITPEIQP